MSDSQKFPVGVHILAYMAHREADSPKKAVSSVELAVSIATHPVVVRRVVGMLAKAKLIETRSGAFGGAWLALKPEEISLDKVLGAVNGCAHLGKPPKGARDCLISVRLPQVIGKIMGQANAAAASELGGVSIADVLNTAKTGAELDKAQSTASAA